MATPLQRVTLRKESEGAGQPDSRQFNFFRGRNIAGRHEWVVEVARFRMPRRFERKARGD